MAGSTAGTAGAAFFFAFFPFFFAGLAFLAGAFFFTAFFLTAFFFAALRAGFFFADFFFAGLRRLVAMGAKGSWCRVARQPQHPFGEDVSLYLTRTSANRQGTSKEISMNEALISKGAERRGDGCPC